MGNEMASGEPSYGMAIMSGRRSGKMQKLVDKLTSRCNELAAERDNILDRYNHSVSENANLRSRCEKLNAMCIELATDYAKAEAERDEARQWARKYKLAYEKQWKATSYHRREGLDWLSWGQEMDKILKGRRAVTAALRAQLAEARNKALEDVVSVVRNMNFELSNREVLVKRIRDLLDSS